MSRKLTPEEIATIATALQTAHTVVSNNKWLEIADEFIHSKHVVIETHYEDE